MEEKVLVTALKADSLVGYTFQWDTNGTKVLIEHYKKLKNAIGTAGMRTMKQLWVVLSEEVSKELGINVTSSHCENRWRVLERNYKKYLDSKSTIGRPRVFFAFAEEMSGLFTRKKMIHHEAKVTLSTKTFNVPDDPKVISNKKVSILDRIREDRLNYQRRRLLIEQQKLEELKRRNDLIKERNDLLKDKKCCPCSNSSSNG